MLIPIVIVSFRHADGFWILTSKEIITTGDDIVETYSRHVKECKEAGFEAMTKQDFEERKLHILVYDLMKKDIPERSVYAGL